jgi:hypothetical protein
VSWIVGTRAGYGYKYGCGFADVVGKVEDKYLRIEIGHLATNRIGLGDRVNVECGVLSGFSECTTIEMMSAISREYR